jgi:hypothetical protein
MQTLDDLLLDLGRRRVETQATLESLASCRQRVDESAKRLESPQAVYEYIDFFSGFFTEAASILDRLVAELPQGAQRPHVEALRQIASNAAVEQRRPLQFRDKWINRPLPHEDVRPLLNQISNDSRDGLTAFRQLNAAADALMTIAGLAPRPAADEGRALDRRELFTKWFGR